MAGQWPIRVLDRAIADMKDQLDYVRKFATVAVALRARGDIEEC